jgi:hypothetical protein
MRSVRQIEHAKNSLVGGNMKSRLPLLVIGFLSLTGCVSPEPASNDFKIFQAIMKAQGAAVDRTNSILQTEIQELKRDLGKAKAKQARLEGSGPRLEQASDLDRSEAASTTEELSRQLKEMSLRLFDIENGFVVDKEKNLAQTTGRFENDRRDIELLQSRFDDQSAQFAVWLGTLQQKIVNQMEEQSKKAHEMIIEIGKKVDERLDTQDHRFTQYEQRMDAFEDLVKTVQVENRVINVFTTIGKKVDERLEAQDHRFTQYEQRMDGFEGLVKTVREENHAIGTAIEAVKQNLAWVTEMLKAGMKTSVQAEGDVNPAIHP